MSDAAAGEPPSLVTFGISFTSVQTAGAQLLADAVLPFEIKHDVFGMDRLKPMR